MNKDELIKQRDKLNEQIAEIEKQESEPVGYERYGGFSEEDILYYPAVRQRLEDCNYDSVSFTNNLGNQDICNLFKFIGHGFKTREAATNYAKLIWVHNKLRELADFEPDWSLSQEKYSFYYNHRDKYIELQCSHTDQRPAAVYFRSEQEAESAMDEIGEDLIIEYLKYYRG